MAWGRVCQKMVALAVAWAEFKLALDDYALMERGGELPAYPDNLDEQTRSEPRLSRNVDA